MFFLVSSCVLSVVLVSVFVVFLIESNYPFFANLMWIFLLPVLAAVV